MRSSTAISPTVFIDALQQEIQRLQYGQEPPELYSPIQYIMNLGGKRLRPLLTLMATYLFGDDWQKAIRPALAVEVFHNFTLKFKNILKLIPSPECSIIYF